MLVNDNTEILSLNCYGAEIDYFIFKNYPTNKILNITVRYFEYVLLWKLLMILFF